MEGITDEELMAMSAAVDAEEEALMSAAVDAAEEALMSPPSSGKRRREEDIKDPTETLVSPILVYFKNKSFLMQSEI